jgi:hypothetical protein
VVGYDGVRKGGKVDWGGVEYKCTLEKKGRKEEHTDALQWKNIKPCLLRLSYHPKRKVELSYEHPYFEKYTMLPIEFPYQP